MMLNRQEIQEWIEFLYNDLLNDDIYIGGYFFRFEQLQEFYNTQKAIDDKIQADLKRSNDKMIQVSKKHKNAQCSELQQAHFECLNDINNLIVYITTKNKFNEIRTFPCTQEEFYFVYNELQDARQDVEHFKQFLTDELKDTKEEDLPSFMQFINDLLDDTRLKFTGKTHNIVLS
jgi:hypothetical protein